MSMGKTSGGTKLPGEKKCAGKNQQEKKKSLGKSVHGDKISSYFKKFLMKKLTELGWKIHQTHASIPTTKGQSSSLQTTGYIRHEVD
jgi:hypothetical protein